MKDKQIEEKDRGICGTCIHCHVCWQCDENTLACSHYANSKDYCKTSEFAKMLKEKAFSIPTVYNSHFGRMIDQVTKELKGTDDEK